jgi:hypothetical protein
MNTINLTNIIRKNYQVIYFNEQSSKGCAMNLIRFGYLQFTRTSLIRELDLYKKLCYSCEQAPFYLMPKILEFALNGLLDSIKIGICFENFLKAMHLLNGFVIHKLHKDIFPVLYKEQYSRPIHISEVLKVANWEINENLEFEDNGLKNQIKGILPVTIGMKELLNKNYLKIIKFPKNVSEICRNHILNRNQLHLYMDESLSTSEQDYKELITLIDFVNTHFVEIHNRIIDEINKDDSYKIKKIEYSA